MATAQANILVNIVTNVKGFLAGMGATQKRFKEMETASGGLNKRFKEMKTRGGRLGLQIRRLTVGFRGFKAEFLSVLFFGMGIQRFFTGLLKPALELTGVFDLFKTALQLLFLPIALVLVEFLIPFIERIVEMDEATKLAIGKFVLIAIAAGIFLFLLGSVALGIAGLILVFGGLLGIIGRLIPDISIAGVNVSSFIEAGLGIAIVTRTVKFLKDILGKVGITWESLKNKFRAGIDFIKEKFGVNLTGEDGVFNVIQELIKDAKEFWIDFSTSIQDEVKDMDIPALIQSFKDLATALEELLPSFKTIAGFITTISKGISAIGAFGKDVIFPGRNFGSDATSFNRIFDRGGGGTTNTNTSNINVTINTTGGISQSDIDNIIRSFGESNTIGLTGLDRANQ